MDGNAFSHGWNCDQSVHGKWLGNLRNVQLFIEVLEEVFEIPIDRLVNTNFAQALVPVLFVIDLVTYKIAM